MIQSIHCREGAYCYEGSYEAYTENLQLSDDISQPPNQEPKIDMILHVYLEV